MKCTFENCEGEIKARGLCERCYARTRTQKDGDTLLLKHSLLAIIQNPEANEEHQREAKRQLDKLGFQMPNSSWGEELLFGMTVEQNIRIWCESLILAEWTKRVLADPPISEPSELEKRPFAEVLAEFSVGKGRMEVLQWRRKQLQETGGQAR